MIKEIGSEFWESPQKRFDKHFFLSGRTALEYIVRDIKAQGVSSSVLLPSYCCHTMIEPFARYGFSIRFYDVFFSEKQKCLCAELPQYREDEVLFYLSYFGFHEINGLNLADLRKKTRTVIDDRTHSWLRTESMEARADYSFTSFRKWGAFSGISEACKYGGSFSYKAGETGNERYVFMRDTAFGMKADYMANGGEKEPFLRMFGEAEDLLGEDYEAYRPSYRAIDAFFSTDWDTVRSRRRENAKILLEGLADVREIILPFSKLDDWDVPLFVPILVENGRDALRKYLTVHQVYCPIHWPVSKYHRLNEKTSCLYENALSLVCDQRYTEKDMQRIVDTIKQFWKEGK